MNAEIIKKHKTFTGIVTSDKMTDTIVVVVERYVKHPKYQKYVQSRKKYKVHDAGNTAKIGDNVVIEETRPISRHKTFKLLEIKK
ncbi:MAG: 30S ribosomal protein S17 [bacterium]|nr:30S ribosomal protein S17 [Patescibacteria group bacterium]MDQ3077028.1 30S ribosomal protein S17 [bacterium]